MSLTRRALHERLREATRAPHRLLDHHPLLAPLVRAEVAPAQYGAALAALHGVHAPLEAAITAFLERHPGLMDYAPRRKLPALQADLSALGWPPDRTPVAADLRDLVLSSLPQLVGILYTLEGSTLGARVMSNHLRTQVASRNFPQRFLSVYGDSTDARWAEFLAWAEQHCPEDQYATAEQAAVALFDAIRHHLDAVAALAE